MAAKRLARGKLTVIDATSVQPDSRKALVQLAREHDCLAVAIVLNVAPKRIVDTRVRHSVTIREANAVAALEVMSRFAMDPRWLIYLPPTMSPSETAPADVPLLERPHEALAYFARNGVARVVCEEKHMGSRAVVVVARSCAAAQARFGVGDGKQGVIYTRTGRPFFGVDETERELIERVASAFEKAGLWDELGTDWACLDTELMPWSLKAIELLRTQYAAVGASASAALDQVVRSLESATERGTGELLDRFRARRQMVHDYSAAWRRYCWTTNSVSDVKLAPFHLLATEGQPRSSPRAWPVDQA